MKWNNTSKTLCHVSSNIEGAQLTWVTIINGYPTHTPSSPDPTLRKPACINTEQLFFCCDGDDLSPE